MKQAELLHGYNDKFREKFNETIFTRNDDDIINELEKVILSCERSGTFTIKVESFVVIDDYAKIQQLLLDYEETCSKNKRAKENIYSYINLRDSDIKLLQVNYLISRKDITEHFKVYIEVPRIVDKYYFRIGGNVYSAMYQIVDASTYNNATSRSKKHVVILKTTFMPIRIYRSYKSLKSTAKENVKCTYYETRTFNKSVSVVKYIFAKYGFYKGLEFLMSNYVMVSKTPTTSDDVYSFMKNDIYINVPKYVFDNSSFVQSLVYTIYKSIIKDTVYADIFTDEFWLKSLGGEFSTLTAEKGLSVLDSLEHIYDIATKESIHLPMDQKGDIYRILRWMIGEFSNLRKKDNTDISTKKIRYAEYIASLYAQKLSLNIYRVSDLGAKATIESIKKAIGIHPEYLLGSITKCKLINYKNSVNDLDSINALKFTYKGISGIGDKSSSTVPTQFKLVNVSHLGRVDLDSSSNSDPGMSGTLCPLVKLYDMSFSEFEEPNFWEAELAKTIDNFKAMVGLKEALILRGGILGEDNSKAIAEISYDIEANKRIINPLVYLDSTSKYCGFPLDASGTISIYTEFE